MTFASLTEAPLIVALLSTSLGSHGEIAWLAAPRASAALATAALLLVMLSETARIPVDNQETHYELTMIHEGLILEYSGWQLALLQLAAHIRQAAFFFIAAAMLAGNGLAFAVMLAVLVALRQPRRASLREDPPLRGPPALHIGARARLGERRLAAHGGRRMVSVVVFLALAVLVTDSQLRTALIAYVAFTIAVLWLSFPHAPTMTGTLLFFSLAAVKLVAGPFALEFLARRYGIPRDLSPSVSLPLRAALVVGMFLAGRSVGQMPAFVDVPLSGLVFSALFSSVAVVVLHRNLLAHIIGLLVLGSAITLAGAVFAPELLGSI